MRAAVVRRPSPAAIRMAAVALTGLVFAVAALGWSAKAWLESSVPAVAALDPESGAVRDAAAQAGDENILLITADSAGASGDGAAGTVVVVHVPAGGGGLVALSLPAELEINRPPCERWDGASASYLGETVPAEARTRLLSAFEVGGPRCATRAVQQLTGLAITRFVAVDLGAVAPLVDAVDGVDVCVERPVLDGVLGPVVPVAGTTTLDGARAADFARAGDVRGDPASDYGRVERQHRVLAALLDEALSAGQLLDPAGLRALATALGAATVADGVGLDQLLALARSLQRLDADGVRFVPVPTGAQPNLRGHAVLREADAAAVFRALREDGPLPEQPDPRAAAAAPTPGDVTVDVLNASGRDGLAGRVGGTLTELGFGVDEVGNAPRPAEATVIRFSPDRAAAAELLAATLPAATTQPAPGGSDVLEIVLGSAFDDVVRTPTNGPDGAGPVPAGGDVPVSCA